MQVRNVSGAIALLATVACASATGANAISAYDPAPTGWDHVRYLNPNGTAVFPGCTDAHGNHYNYVRVEAYFGDGSRNRLTDKQRYGDVIIWQLPGSKYVRYKDSTGVAENHDGRPKRIYGWCS